MFSDITSSLFEAADVDFNGEVSVYELVSLLALLTGSGCKLDRLTKIFKVPPTIS